MILSLDDDYVVSVFVMEKATTHGERGAMYFAEIATIASPVFCKMRLNSNDLLRDHRQNKAIISIFYRVKFITSQGRRGYDSAYPRRFFPESYYLTRLSSTLGLHHK